MNEGAHRGGGSRSLIGRNRELAELTAGLDEAVAGRGGVWLVTGEPGIGKSRLTEEVANQANERGMSVHWGRCWEAGGAPAYWPWIQVLRSLLGSRDNAKLVPDTAAARLSQILPELEDRLPVDGEVAQLEPEQALFALMDAVTDALCSAASAKPMVVLLEDLHAADPASITLLDFVNRQLQATPLLVVGNYRQTEARREGIGEGLAKITRGARTVRLARLEIDEVAKCIREVTGTDSGPRVTAAIHEASEGNPLYVVEIAGLMQSRGELEAGGDRVDIAIPDSVKAVIRERAAGLDETTREQLEAAAVIGREFRTDDLAVLLELDLEDVEGPLAEAAAIRIIEPGSAGSHRFTHFLTREVFHSSLVGLRRRDLHLRRAELLQQRAVGGLETPWSELAHHLLEAGPEADARALEASARAAEQAVVQFAFDDAAELLERALIVSDRLPGVDPIERCDLLLDRAQALLKAGNIAEGREICRESADIARRLGNSDILARSALVYGSVFVYADVDPTLVELLRETLVMLDESDSALRARLQARLAAAMQPADDPEEAMELARDAIAMARRVGDRESLLHAIRAGCSALMDIADPAERLALNREHVTLAEELGKPFEGLRGHLRIVIDALDLGDPEASDMAIEAYDRLASQTRLPHHRWPVSSFHAMRAMMDGRFDDADRLLNEARHHAERIEDPNAERTLALQSIGLARAREDFGEATRLHESARTELPSSAFTGYFLRILEGSTLGRMDRLDEMPPGIFDRLIAEIVSSSDTDRSVLCPAAEMVAASGNQEAAEFLFQRLEPYAENWITWGLYGMVCEGPVSRHLALLASSLGRAEEADRYFEHALKNAQKRNARPIAARIGYEFARHLTRVDASSERMVDLLRSAGGTAADLGLKGLLDLIQALGGGERESAPAGPEIVPTVSSFGLEREGEIWLCCCGDESFSLKNTKGVRMLARLVAEKGREIHVLDLSGAAPAEQAVDVGDAGEVLDPTAKAQYQRRVEELKSEIEEAEGFNDPGRAERARDELELIAAELSKAFGLGGRERRSGSAAERARVNVQRRLRDAVRRIAEHSPAAGKHLDWALKTGLYCSYDPS